MNENTNSKKHPLEHIVEAMAKSGKIIDVSILSVELSGASVFTGKDSTKGTKAYRIVAADVLSYMELEGRLERHGCWGNNKEDGGPWFTVPTPAVADKE
jgi:hypothetical protein